MGGRGTAEARGAEAGFSPAGKCITQKGHQEKAHGTSDLMKRHETSRTQQLMVLLYPESTSPT